MTENQEGPAIQVRRTEDTAATSSQAVLKLQ
jgi:hypothetical protein